MAKLTEIWIWALFVTIWCIIPQNEGREVVSKSEIIESNLPIVTADDLSRDANYTECGGVVDVKLNEMVVIEYKVNEEYNNNEMCVWTLRNNEGDGMLLRKITSGFERGFDFLQVSFFYQAAGAVTTKIMGNITDMEEVSERYPLAFLILSTDESNTGTGFRLEIVGFGRRNLPYYEEDFFTMLPTGSNSLQPYYDPTFTSWVIAPNNPEINLLDLKVEYDMFTNNNNIKDEIFVFQLQRNGRAINFLRLDVLSGVGTECYSVYYYTTYVVTFQSDRSSVYDDLHFVNLHWHGSNSNGTSSEACQKIV